MSQLIVTTLDELTHAVTLAVRRELSLYQAQQLGSDDSMTTEQAAIFLTQSKNTLRQWRCQGKGPAYEKRGRTIRYAKSALIAWRDANMVVTADSMESQKIQQFLRLRHRAEAVNHA